MRDPDLVRRALLGCDGIVHLAAVSVGAAQQSPEVCWETNVLGTANVLEAAMDAERQPSWCSRVVAKSTASRARLRLPRTPFAPSTSTADRRPRPRNSCRARGQKGLLCCAARLANVYGDICNHADRVIPAFVRASVRDAPLRVDDAAHTLDFTHVRDMARGLVSVCELLHAGQAVPTLHLVSGAGTRLGELAALVWAARAHSRSIERTPAPRVQRHPIHRRPPSRASAVLGWAPQRLGWRRRLALLMGERSSGRARLAVFEEDDAMRVLKVIHGYPMRYNAGSEVYSQTLCHGLAERHEVHVFTREETVCT